MRLKKKEGFLKKLSQAIDAENTSAICYWHLSALIKNGKSKSKLKAFSTTSKENKALLLERLKGEGKGDFALEKGCEFCKMDPQDLSVIGSVNLGLEMTKIAAKLYKDLLASSRTGGDRSLFKRILNTKTDQNRFLRREKSFAPEAQEA
ncbi:MAG: hypothetical protein ABID09_08005 [Candidatus Omnitrophota bacterium]